MEHMRRAAGAFETTVVAGTRYQSLTATLPTAHGAFTFPSDGIQYALSSAILPCDTAKLPLTNAAPTITSGARGTYRLTVMVACATNLPTGSTTGP